MSNVNRKMRILKKESKGNLEVKNTIIEMKNACDGYIN
jgi:hypothetical protein